MKVAVYFNLHKETFRVRAMQGANKGRVIMHADRVTLKDVKFKVSEAGRQRVIREKRKNVHAFVVGELVSVDNRPIVGELITYNPYVYNTFVTAFDKTPIKSAQTAHLICEDKKARIYA